MTSTLVSLLDDPRWRRAEVEPRRPDATVSRGWSLPGLAGRLCELSGLGPVAGLTLALDLVREAQDRGEPTAWITARRATFFPPDAAAGGVDLERLPVVFAAGPRDAARAAGRLLRSGAFGLVVLDLASSPAAERGPRGRRGRHRPVGPSIPMPLQSRLVGLAQQHETAVLCLTEKGADAPSLGSLVSLRCEAHRELIDARFLCSVEALKDKRGGPGWSASEERRGPPGMC